MSREEHYVRAQYAVVYDFLTHNARDCTLKL